MSSWCLYTVDCVQVKRLDDDDDEAVEDDDDVMMTTSA